jgi:hypothetical protein
LSLFKIFLNKFYILHIPGEGYWILFAMKNVRIFLLLFLVLVLCSPLFISSCRHNADISDIPEVCFEGTILPILKNSCAIAGCHDGQGESGLRLDNYLDISHAVIPGKPFSSSIFKSITATMGESKMPPGQPLSVENRILIRLWIEQGAKLTVCPVAGGNNNGGGSYLNPRACFTRDILPVLVSRCASSGCHDAVTHKEGYIFSSYSTTLNTVRPGNPGDSKLFKVITSNSEEDKMPPAGSPQLSLAEIDSIGKWISYGALNEACGETCDTLNPVTFSGVIWPVVQSGCTGCHSGASPSGNISLTSYNNVATVASNGLLIKALKGIGVTKMPPAGSFSACKIRQFEIWVNNGFLNN